MVGGAWPQGRGRRGGGSLTPLGPLRPSPQMWTSARLAGAASTGSVPTRMVGTRACAPTASCWTHPAAAASVSHPEGPRRGPSPRCAPRPIPAHPGPFLSLNTPRSAKTPRSLIIATSDFLDLLQPFLRTPCCLQIPSLPSAPPGPQTPSPPLTRTSSDPEIRLGLSHSDSQTSPESPSNPPNLPWIPHLADPLASQTLSEMFLPHTLAQHVISEAKGPCFRVLRDGGCSLPILRNITKQICCCSRVGKAWGRGCQLCPPFGSGERLRPRPPLDLTRTLSTLGPAPRL